MNRECRLTTEATGTHPRRVKHSCGLSNPCSWGTRLEGRETCLQRQPGRGHQALGDKGPVQRIVCQRNWLHTLCILISVCCNKTPKPVGQHCRSISALRSLKIKCFDQGFRLLMDTGTTDLFHDMAEKLRHFPQRHLWGTHSLTVSSSPITANHVIFCQSVRLCFFSFGHTYFFFLISKQ